MATHHLSVLIFVLVFFPHRVFNYEKTLRKIVRNQSKMVQRPFSDNGGQGWWWNHTGHHSQIPDSIITPGFSQPKVFQRLHRPKVSTLLDSTKSQRGKSAFSKILSKNTLLNDLRQARNTLASKGLQTFESNEYHTDQKQSNSSFPMNIAIENFYQIPTHSKFFPPVDMHEMQSAEDSNSKERPVIFPENPGCKDNGSVVVRSTFVSRKNVSDIKEIMPKSKQKTKSLTIVEDVLEGDSDKADYLLHGSPVDAEGVYSYNVSMDPYVCNAVVEAEAEIDAQHKFSELDIEPPWAARKHFWNSIFDSRYESLMRNAKWPPLKVILVPRSHVDSIWKKTFERYHNDSVSKILSNVVKKLQFYPNMTFSWNEVSHLSRWWRSTSQKSRSALKRLLKKGKLEITTGGWVECDEATTHLFSLVHQLVEGHEWLKRYLNYYPKTGWLSNTVTHSPTMTYLLSALDIHQIVLTNLHYSWEQFLAEYQYSDFIWLQQWDTDTSSSTHLNDALGILGVDRHPKHAVFTHYLQFNSAGFRACGPNTAVCVTDFNFAKSSNNFVVNHENVKEKSEALLEQYSKTGTITPHNTIIAPLGTPYAYESQLEFDFQYNNYQKIATFVNDNQGIYKATMEFGTPADYFKTIFKKIKKNPTLKGDFLNYADVFSGTPAYWTGFYTSRPFLKILLRRLESTMRTTEILFSFALSLNTFREYNVTQIYILLTNCRQNFARLLDRNVMSGTLPANAITYVHKLIFTTVKDCWYIQEVTTSLLTAKPGFGKPYLQKYVYREGEFISTFKTIAPEDQVYIFNSLSHERTEVVELMTRHPNLRIIDYNRKEVTLQINPIWKYSADNIIKLSKRFFKITFVVVIPPMTLELFKIQKTYDAAQSFAAIYCSTCVVDDSPSSVSTFPFSIQPVETGDIQLESYKHRLIFDELTGFLKTIVEKETNIAKAIVIDFGAFRDADVNSGMFLFNTNVSKPLIDILMPYRVGSKSKVTIIVSGRITTEMSTVFGRFLQHTIRLFNLIHSSLSSAIHLETKVDYEVSPKNREVELFMSIQTDIANGNPPRIHTDNNGFQYTARVLNISRRIESNMYPITSMAYIQDHRSRLTYLTDHAQGVTALQEGQLVVMLDRRVLFNDGRGVNEGLADSSTTYHRQYILLENYSDINKGPLSTAHDLSQPSLTAMHLADSLNYLLDLFIVDQNGTDYCHYGFLPLVKTSFPCDVTLINFRVVLPGIRRDNPNLIPTSALLILHKRSFSCKVEVNLRCNGETVFFIDRIFRNVRAVYQTNLAGTSKGTPLFTFRLLNFPPMEIVTLRLYF